MILMVIQWLFLYVFPALAVDLAND